MRWTKWAASFAVIGMIGFAACAEQAEEQPVEEQPAAEAPAGAPAQPPTGQVPEGATAEMVAQGQQLFTGQGNCFTCHGMDAKGSQLAPDLTDGEWLWLDPARGDLMAQAEALIRSGVPQPKQYPAPMPPMGGAQLSDEQIRALAAYVLSLGGAR